MAFRLRRPPKLVGKHQAYPYQLDAVRAVENLPYAAIFHEQGLGKTKIAVDLMLRWLSDDVVDTVFVITKKTLVRNWANEISNHTYVTPRALTGNRRENSIALNSPVLIYLLNYEVISANVDLIREFLGTCRVAGILDESQKIKNPEARISVCLHSIAERFVRRVIMTGTPVANRPFDIWSQVRFLDAGRALGSSFETFRAELDLPSRGAHQRGTMSERDRGDGGGAESYGGRLSRVMERIRNFTVRETKETAGLALPDKTIRTVSVDLAPHQSVIYASYRDALMYEIRGRDGLTTDDAENLLKRLLRLVQCASNPGLVDDGYEEEPAKLSRLLQLAEEVDLRVHKAIVWTCFVENVEWLSAQLLELRPAKVHGGMTVDERNRSIDRFSADNTCRVLVATPGAAKEGLTLTAANHAVFYDRGFSLDDYLQAQDRIHRISQRVDCFVHNLIARNTIDEWIDQLLHAKYEAARVTQGDISSEEFDTSIIFDLPDQLLKVLSPAPSENDSKREVV